LFEYARAGLFIWFYVTAWFVLSLVMKRNDVADVAWGLGPTLLAWWFAFQHGLWPPSPLLLAALLTTVWGCRLAYHIAMRDFAFRHEEDGRYAAWRAEWKFFKLRSYLQVFLLQGVFMLLLCSPLIVLAASPDPQLPVLTILGAWIWAAGFAIEAIADTQLRAFLAVPREERPRVMDQGLWSWSRHPNYFGESLMWWGLAVLALGANHGLFALLGPVTITVLLVFVSGIPLVEARHIGDPDWDAYKARTSAFVPLPPKRD
jgi:steroid 5-alpha reductase family enzyme